MAERAEAEAGPDVEDQKNSRRLRLREDSSIIDDDPERISKLYFRCSISNIRCEGLQTYNNEVPSFYLKFHVAKEITFTTETAKNEFNPKFDTKKEFEYIEKDPRRLSIRLVEIELYWVPKSKSAKKVGRGVRDLLSVATGPVMSQIELVDEPKEGRPSLQGWVYFEMQMHETTMVKDATNRDELKDSVKKQFPRAKSKTLKELKSPNVFNFYQLTIRERISLKELKRSALVLSLKPTTPLTEADRLAEAATVIPLANLIDLRQNRAMIFLGEMKSKWTHDTVAIADGKLVWALQPRFAQMNGGIFNSRVGIIGGSPVPYAIRPRVHGRLAKLFATVEEAAAYQASLGVALSPRSPESTTSNSTQIPSPSRQEASQNPPNAALSSTRSASSSSSNYSTIGRWTYETETVARIVSPHYKSNPMSSTASSSSPSPTTSSSPPSQTAPIHDLDATPKENSLSTLSSSWSGTSTDTHTQSRPNSQPPSAHSQEPWQSRPQSQAQSLTRPDSQTHSQSSSLFQYLHQSSSASPLDVPPVPPLPPIPLSQILAEEGEEDEEDVRGNLSMARASIENPSDSDHDDSHSFEEGDPL